MARYMIKNINGELVLAKTLDKVGILKYITLKRLREIDDDLYDKVYNNRRLNNFIALKFRHECYIFFKGNLNEIKKTDVSKGIIND